MENYELSHKELRAIILASISLRVTRSADSISSSFPVHSVKINYFRKGGKRHGRYEFIETGKRCFAGEIFPGFFKSVG